MYRELSEIENNRALDRFVRHAQSTLAHGTLWNLRDAFRQLLRSDAPAKVVNHCLEELACNSKFVHGSASETNWSFLDFGSFSMSFTILPPGFDRSGKPLTTLPNDHLVGVVGGGAAHLRLFEVVEGAGAQNGSSSVLAQVSDLRMVKGDICELRAGQHAYRFVTEAEPAVLMILSGPTRLRTTQLFSADSMSAFCTVATIPGDSRIEVTAKVLADFKRRESIAALAALQKHPSHFVRWTALRCVGLIDRNAAVTLLREAVGDSHPHVRSAASKTLASLNQLEAV